MKKVVVALALVLYSWLAINVVYGSTEPPNEVDQWLYRVTKGKAREKVTHLRFFVQDVVTGPNASVVTVARGPESNKSLTGFGLVNIIDVLLTETPEPTSKPVGRAQGLAGFSSKDELAFLMVINFVFTGGKFNGSSLTMLGRNPVVHPLREMPIVGGTGVFRLARGIVTTKTDQVNTTSNNGVYEYNAFAVHY